VLADEVLRAAGGLARPLVEQRRAPVYMVPTGSPYWFRPRWASHCSTQETACASAAAGPGDEGGEARQAAASRTAILAALMAHPYSAALAEASQWTTCCSDPRRFCAGAERCSSSSRSAREAAPTTACWASFPGFHAAARPRSRPPPEAPSPPP